MTGILGDLFGDDGQTETHSEAETAVSADLHLGIESRHQDGEGRSRSDELSLDSQISVGGSADYDVIEG